MTKYTPATVAKAAVGGVVAAIGAATAAAGGPDLSHLDFGSWVGVVGAGMTAFGAVFVTPNKDHKPAPEPVSPVEQVINNLPAVVQSAAAANADLQKVTQAATSMLGLGVDVVSTVEQAIARATKQ